MSVQSSSRNSIMWFRRDLRVGEHPALRAAVEHAAAHGGHVLPIFVFDERLLGATGPNRAAALFETLRHLRSAGVPLTVMFGDPVELVPRIAAEHDADVFVSADFGAYGSRRDRETAKTLSRVSRAFQVVDSPYLVPPGTVRKGDGTPFSVFTPFKRVWLERARGQRPGAPVRPEEVRWSRESGLGDIPAGSPTSTRLPAMSESAAQGLAMSFFDSVMRGYAESRDIPAINGTSRLSPYLKFGILHPRQLLAPIESAIDAGSPGAATFLSELCWREFYADVLFRRPDSARVNFAPNMDLETDSGATADARFEAWAYGRTGFPFIDAGMRQLLAEGWMHNRVRMATASFLVKDLHLPWQRGARWFMHHLIDGDLASNQHGWQWTAGTGTDAAPYFRVFNPVLQGKKFDPAGAYIARWVPELQGRPVKEIHEPWLAARPSSLFDGGKEDGGRYPSPIVDHAAERDVALSRLKAIKQR